MYLDLGRLKKIATGVVTRHARINIVSSGELTAAISSFKGKQPINFPEKRCILINLLNRTYEEILNIFIYLERARK